MSLEKFSQRKRKNGELDNRKKSFAENFKSISKTHLVFSISFSFLGILVQSIFGRAKKPKILILWDDSCYCRFSICRFEVSGF